MSDREKVEWLRMLLILWGSIFAPLLMMALGAPAAINDAPAAIGALLVFYAVVTLIYLLILSWRAAYLSGKGKR